MGNGKYTNFIKHYDTIRHVLRNLYIYGCYTRDDFAQKKISSRKYDNERRRIMNYINSENLRENTQGHKKYVYLFYDMFKFTENFLSDSFFTKSFNYNDLVLYFYILQLLDKNQAPMSVEEIAFEISKIVPEENIRFESFEESTVRRKLNQLAEENILQLKAVKNKKLYGVSDDFFKDFSEAEITDLLYMTAFYSNILPFSIPGFYLKETLQKYLEYERHLPVQYNDVFMFKHNHLHNIVDNEVVWTIIKCLDKNKSIRFNYNSPLTKLKTSEEKKLPIHIPVKIIVDLLYGRQFLLAYDTSLKKPSLYRIDKMQGVTEGDEIFNSKLTCREDLEEPLRNSWCATLLNENTGYMDVEVEFNINEDTQSYILDRIKREGKWGTITKLKQNKYLYSIKVTNAEELIPWLRTFAGFIKVRPSSMHNIAERLNEDWQVSLKNYGVI